MKLKHFKLVKIGFFCAILILIINCIAFVSKPVQQQKQILLYDSHEEQSIDIAFVGSSSTYRYYDMMAIWENYGITSATYYNSSLPFEFTIPMIKIINEKQSPEIYVFELRKVLEDEFNIRFTSSRRAETDKSAYINALYLLCNPLDRIYAVNSLNYFSGENYMYGLELLTSHDSFTSNLNDNYFADNQQTITPIDFNGNQNLHYAAENLQEEYIKFEPLLQSDYELTQETQDTLTELFDYCKENDINAYFTFTPYVDQRNSQDIYIRKAICDFVESNGYPIKDFREDFEIIGLDPAIDFYDSKHVNAVGAEKFTLYAIEYYLQEYNITPNYSDNTLLQWQEEYEEWLIYDDMKMEELQQQIESIKKDENE